MITGIAISGAPFVGRVVSWRRGAAFGAVLPLLVLGAPPASACGWLWACGDRPLGYQHAPRGYVPGSPAWAYRRTWAYGYRNGNGNGNGDATPGWAYGYIYAARPSATIAPSRWYVDTAPAVPNSTSVGLTAPIASGEGLLEGGLPPRGPSLFGPNPPPAAWGYRYGHHYRPSPYGYPSYGYYGGSSAYTPPRDTASWWLEPRRRR